MRSIAEIKEDIEMYESAYMPADVATENLTELNSELRLAIIDGIPLDELEQYAQARSEGCGYCKGDGEVSFVYHVSQTDCGIQAAPKFCPMCGRRLGNTP